MLARPYGKTPKTPNLILWVLFLPSLHKKPCGTKQKTYYGYSIKDYNGVKGSLYSKHVVIFKISPARFNAPGRTEPATVQLRGCQGLASRHKYTVFCFVDQ